MIVDFVVDGWSLSGECGVDFHYRSEKFGEFTERLIFPRTRRDLSDVATNFPGLLDITSIVLGVSYYKTNPTGAVGVPSGLPEDALALAHALYTEGLAEFYVRNGIEYPPPFELRARGPAACSDARCGDHRGQRNENVSKHPGAKAIAAFGGGKDSHVALALLKKASIPVEPVVVALSSASANKLQSMSCEELTVISRRLDPALVRANAAGALNGHVPITAINSLILVLYALMQEVDWVVFANERSADEPTMVLHGHEVNHQFSKTYRCENLLRRCLRSISPRLPEYFSILRPVSELWIARELVELPAALSVFSSCNRNFVLSGPNALPPGVRWCGVCAKCVFTALVTAPFLSRAKSIEVFGSDVLHNSANGSLVRELVGLSDSKPWDCVGEMREAAAALWQLRLSDDWKSVRAIGEHIGALSGKWGAEYLDDAFYDALVGKRTSFLPRELMFIYEP